jgi:DNA-binding Lrp family transcriptional regulator
VRESAGRTALVAIAKRDGKITPWAVLDDARDPSNPLHQYFEWDDGEAAERYRIIQAAGLIRRYKFVVQMEPERTARVRSFVVAPDKNGETGYIPTEEAMRTGSSRDFVMQQALREVAALRAKYQALVDFDEVLHRSMNKRKRRSVA